VAGTLLAGQPNDQQTSYDFKETIEESISFRGNAYIWKNKDPQTGRVVELYALHPDQVFVNLLTPRIYRVGTMPGFVDPTGKGFGFYDVDASRSCTSRVSAVAGRGSRRARSSGSGAARRSGRRSRRSATRTACTPRAPARSSRSRFPDGKQPEQVRAWRDLWRETYEGPQNAGRTAVLGGGATIQPIGLSLVDTQFIESQNFSVEEMARIFDVLASLIGGGSKKGDNPLTPEHETDRWLRYHLGPRLTRIESGFAADQDLFGPTARDYPMFDTNGVLRGDLQTEDAIAHAQVQDGRLLVDEWRKREGLPPLPDGAGSVPQIVPVGGGANPAQPPSAHPSQPAPPASDPAAQE
jgi:phage portal protein BeeE